MYYGGANRSLSHSYWLGPSPEDQTWLASSSSSGATSRSLDALGEAEVALMKRKDDVRQFAPGYPIPGASADRNGEGVARRLVPAGGGARSSRGYNGSNHIRPGRDDGSDGDGSITLARRRARSGSDDDGGGAGGYYEGGGSGGDDIILSDAEEEAEEEQEGEEQEEDDGYWSGSTEEARDRRQFNISMSP